MTDEELRERFKVRQHWLLAHYNEFDSPTEVDELIKESVEQFMADIKQNYVRLAKDQSLPEPKKIAFELPESCQDTLMVSPMGIALEVNLSKAYTQAQQDMLKARFRKVEK